MPSVHTLVTATNCRSCGAADLVDVMGLKPMPPAGRPPDHPRGVGEQTELFPLILALCEKCGLVQLRLTLPLERHFSDYPYRTATRPGLERHFEELARSVDRLWLPSGGTLVEVGCNDGTFLKSLRKRRPDARLVGVDPAASLRTYSVIDDIDIRTSFFDDELASELLKRNGPADVILLADVLPELADLQGALWGLFNLLAQEGVIIFEVSHLAALVEFRSFPLISHETLSYFSFATLSETLERANLRLIEIEMVPTEGGSLRVTACGPSSARYLSDRGAENLEAILARERELMLTESWCFEKLQQRVEALGPVTGPLFRDLADHAGPLIGFGAGPRATTFVHQLGLADAFDAIVDDNELVQDRFLARTDIPIVPPQAVLSRRDRYCVLFEWEYPDAAMAALRSAGFKGQFIVPCPEPRFLTEV